MGPLPNGPQLPPRPAVPMGAYLPAGQPRPATVFSQVAASLQQPVAAGVAIQTGAPPGQPVGQRPVAVAPGASPQPAQPWQPPAMQGLPPLKRVVGKELCILDLGDAQRRKFLRVGPASCQWYHRSWLPGPAALLIGGKLPYKHNLSPGYTALLQHAHLITFAVQMIMFYGIDTRPGGGYDWERYRIGLKAREAESKWVVSPASAVALQCYVVASGRCRAAVQRQSCVPDCNDRVAPTFKAVDAYGQLLVELMAAPMAGADDSYYSTTFRVSTQQAPTSSCQLLGI
jgi:hypothetical protein